MRAGDWKFDEIHIREGRRNKGKELLNAAQASTGIKAFVDDQQFNLLEDGKPPVNFEMKNHTLVVKEQLDREKKATYELTIGVTNRLTGDIIEEETSFTVVVDDLNDNKPVFGSPSYTLRLPEHSTKGTLALLDDPVNQFIFATDKDERSPRKYSMRDCEVGTGNGDISYRITNQREKWFTVKSCYNRTIDQFVAQISLDKSDTARLDRENPPELDFRLEAQDLGYGKGNGEPSFTSDPVNIKIELDDINDNAPRFVSSDISLSAKEDLPVGSEIARIPVIDEDIGENKAFEVSVQNDPLALFYAEPSIDYTEVVVKHAKPLDYEERSVHNFMLSIKSRDMLEGKVKSGTSTINVQLNVVNVDEPPEFKKGVVVYVAENQPPSTKVAGTLNLASDPENHSFR